MVKSKLVTEETLEQRITKLCREFEARAEENVKLALLSCENKHKKMLHNFVAHTNHVREELQGASEDHLSMHDDKLNNHEERIIVLETV